jgi:hypothetical protein
MIEECRALLGSDTWDLVPPQNAIIVPGKWVFCHKLNPDGSLDRYKARWVLHSFSQEQGVDFDKTFSPFVKPATVCVILSIALSLKWETFHLNVKNTFLQSKLTEVVYSCQPTSFIDSTRPEHVCQLNHFLYGLKQAPHAWYQCFAERIVKAPRGGVNRC